MKRACGAGLEVGVDVPARHGGEQRGDDAEPDRSGGEVGDVGVLGAAGVALQPAEVAEAEQVVAIELALEVLDRVEHRRRVRLDRDLVVAAEVAEPERRHDAHHRRAGRHVPADLHAELGVATTGRGPRRPLAVGVVDHPHGQPQHAPLDLVECREIDRRFGHADSVTQRAVGVDGVHECTSLRSGGDPTRGGSP